MKIGSLIKYHRTKQGLTQNELAMGICSIPHLSKIENNSKEANEETIRLLLEKLNIQLQEVVEREQYIVSLLSDLQKHIYYVNKQEAVNTFEKLVEYGELIPFTNQIYLYELYKLRYYIFTSNLKLARLQLSILSDFKRNFSQYERYLHSLFNALLLIIDGKYQAADKEFVILLQKHVELGLFGGDVYYHLAIVKYRLDESGQAIIFSRKALNFYKDEYNFKRILYTLMSLALYYSNEKLYQEALETYEHLLRNVEVLHEHHLLSQIYQNLGLLYLRMGDNVQALSYYEKSTSITTENHQLYSMGLYNLGFTQFEMGLYEESKKSFLVLKKKAKNPIYINLATFYLLLLNLQENEAMEFLEMKLISQLSKIHDLNEVYLYLKNILKEYLLKKEKYEKALQFSV
jgi:HTH-type transcriptional regulator, quorum sensing regulator NprR